MSRSFLNSGTLIVIIFDEDKLSFSFIQINFYLLNPLTTSAENCFDQAKIFKTALVSEKKNFFFHLL
jgi:hypothetical protein